VSQRAVFITGAGSGIGAALARHYAGLGRPLGLLARSADSLEALAATLPVPSARYAADVTDAAALANAAADFIGRFGPPEIVIASAGISAGTLTEIPEDLPDFRRIMDVNVYGMAASFAPFIAAMKSAALRGASATLVGIASVSGIRGLPGAGAYSASKAAAIAYLESLRVEVAGSGIRVVTIAPGYIATPMTEHNPYRMPFRISADEAARRFARAIGRGTSYTVIPWPMAIVAKMLRLLPNAIYDRLFAKAPRKPRNRQLR
jgi:NAD(P)-dependent dehydrogenase (short-subunit alcohol dehydrogenase family)